MPSDHPRSEYPFRLGSTSYVYPADILPNVERLAPIVDDVELVLFELDDGPSNLPDSHTLQRLSELAAEHDVTYTVHLPLDLRLTADGSEQEASLEKARRVIECTRTLAPHAYVVHLDGIELHAPNPDTERWHKHACRSLEIVGAWARDLSRIAVENLERYDTRWILGVLDEVPASLCIDIGHLWLDDKDPMPYLQSHLERTRVIHLHGLAERDHKSLVHTPPELLDPVIHHLLESQYSGVLTLEVFCEEDFFGSVEALEASVKRRDAAP